MGSFYVVFRVLQLGTSWTSPNCQAEYTCALDANNVPAITEIAKGCGQHEACDGAGQCKCTDGYQRGDDGTCQPREFSTNSVPKSFFKMTPIWASALVSIPPMLLTQHTFITRKI